MHVLKGSGTGPLPPMLEQYVRLRDEVTAVFPNTLLLFQCSETQRGVDVYAMITSVVETAKCHTQHLLDVLVGLQVRAAPR